MCVVCTGQINKNNSEIKLVREASNLFFSIHPRPKEKNCLCTFGPSAKNNRYVLGLCIHKYIQFKIKQISKKRTEENRKKIKIIMRTKFSIDFSAKCNLFVLIQTRISGLIARTSMTNKSSLLKRFSGEMLLSSPTSTCLKNTHLALSDKLSLATY